MRLLSWQQLQQRRLSLQLLLLLLLQMMCLRLQDDMLQSLSLSETCNKLVQCVDLCVVMLSATCPSDLFVCLHTVQTKFACMQAAAPSGEVSHDDKHDAS